ncbi:MAG: MoaD/ThiS family protein [Chloroflexi bacterium]|nr:MoaD/ThiS family protein [Chloroflexota bacterium]
MRITFCAYGDLRRYTPQNQERLPLAVEEQTSVAALLDRLDVPWGEVGIVAINGKLADEKYVVAEGDKVEVFSPVGGGS